MTIRRLDALQLDKFGPADIAVRRGTNPKVPLANTILLRGETPPVGAAYHKHDQGLWRAASATDLVSDLDPTKKSMLRRQGTTEKKAARGPTS